jgi:signal transduction histidine kinase
MNTLDTAPGAGIIVDSDYTVIDGNVRAEMVFREDLEEIRGTKLDSFRDWGLIDHQTLNELKGDIDRVLDGESGDISSQIDLTPGTDDEYAYNLRIFPPSDSEDETVRCTFRSVGTRERYEETITALHVATRGLVEADDIEDVLAQTAEAAHDVLGFPGTSVRRYNPEMEMLELVAFGAVVNKHTTRPPYPVHDSPHGTAFLEGRTVIDNIDPDDDPYDREDFTQTMYIPIGETGILSVGTVGNTFDETDVRFAEILAENAATAIRVVDTTATLRNQRKRLEQFASIVSHDLKNPLNSAELYLDLAMDTGEREYLEQVEDSLDRMDEMIENLLTMARIDAHDFQKEPIPLHNLTIRTWESVVNTDATLHCALSKERTVHGKAELLRHVFENLFRNAIEHNEPPVTVTVGSLPDEQGFYIEDDGVGIPANQHDHVFDYGHTTAENGNGFGLAIVERVIDVHGWSIDVTGGEHGGARFEIRTQDGREVAEDSSD